jgi:hypothetical protein
MQNVELIPGPRAIPLEARARISGNPWFLSGQITSRSHCFFPDRTYPRLLKSALTTQKKHPNFSYTLSTLLCGIHTSWTWIWGEEIVSSRIWWQTFTRTSNQTSTRPQVFVRTGPRLCGLTPQFLSGQNLGFRPEKSKFCPVQALGSKGIVRGPLIPRRSYPWGCVFHRKKVVILRVPEYISRLGISQ